MDATAQSYVCGTSNAPLRYETIGDALGTTAARYGEREALVVTHQDVRLSWAELDAAVTELAAAFLSLGLEPGDRVGIWSPNNAEWVLTQLATARAGLILVCVNPAYRISELEFALNKVGCRALVTAERLKTSDYLAMLEALAPELPGSDPGELAAARLPELRWVITLGETEHAGCLTFDALRARATAAQRERLAALRPTLQADDAINIQFTSGTTGAPKGATLSHFNILNNGRLVAATQHFTAEDRLCIPVPLYHCFGMVMGVLGCVTHGTAMIFPGEVFEPHAVLEAVQAERCTALYGVPTMFIAELGLPEFADFDLSTLRTGVMAGAPCPVEVMKRVQAEMHMTEVTICYGMTETSPVSFQSHVDDPLDKRVATVGRIHPHVQVKIVDEHGRVVGRGETGELCTRGYCVMQGYWDDAERTAEAIDAAGWMHTGDLAVMDDDGYVNIVGRVKDMIIRGGENIGPREIEEYLYRHDAVADVAVFGVPDAKYGEAVAAWIMVKDGASLTEPEVRAFCDGQIAHYKVPRHIKFVSEFPMTVTGKLQKFVMRDAFAAELGLTEARTA
ncbi:MAG: AMP-binding protein [Pseudomonadales bacterium]|jgi:fatty-acyl-CoA synthase|nr:AMP-binding protein [Pseudomonadales bacterium]